jgi:ADP-ribose pyrophosphatase YjhB (NUDIX family)
MARDQSRKQKLPEQVAVIALRRTDDLVHMCLIRRKGSRKWGIPKGFVDAGDTPEEAALNEACEEAGLTGHLIGDSIGSYDYEKRGIEYTVAVYLMEVLNEQPIWQEMTFRERRWSALQEANALLSAHPVRPLLDRAAAKIVGR